MKIARHLPPLPLCLPWFTHAAERRPSVLLLENANRADKAAAIIAELQTRLATFPPCPMK